MNDNPENSAALEEPDGAQPQPTPPVSSGGTKTDLDPTAAVIKHIHRPILISGMLLGLAFLVLGVLFGGAVGSIALYGLQAYPFALIAVLAYKGITGRLSRIFSWLPPW